MKVAAIVAMSKDRVIGAGGKLPWHFPEDMKHFVNMTTGHSVLMGRKTYQSIPQRFRPLSNRTNIVLSRNLNWKPEEDIVLSNQSPPDTVKKITEENQNNSEILWIIGGEQIYSQTIELCDEIHLTLVDGKFEGDAFFPEFENDFHETKREKKADLSFIVYQRTKESQSN